MTSTPSNLPLDQKWVFKFSSEKTEGSKDQRDLLGGKGANLAEMCSLKLPVPPGFTISTEACNVFYDQNEELWDELKNQILENLKEVERLKGQKFGDNENPLLVSVRSGSRKSMPGMMDTVLNLGLNETITQAMASKIDNPRFAWDSYRRFIQMFSDVVMGVNPFVLDSVLEDLKEARGVNEDTALSAEDLQELCSAFKDVLIQDYGVKFPEEPLEQLWMAVKAVFKSWNNPRAIKYRDLHGYEDSWGTAVNVQSMVFGNLNERSGTGVCFTRDPSTGEKIFFGEYLVNAQGEDVVAGIRTPLPINKVSVRDSAGSEAKTLEELFPNAYAELVTVYQKLEKHYRDMQDIEFTIENDKLYLLQTRSGKRTVAAAIKIAVDLVSEGLLSKEEALFRIDPIELNVVLHPCLEPGHAAEVLTKGLPASPGAVSGKIALTSATAESWAQNGEQVILVRNETSPEDIGGMSSSEGILTARGGMTSHAAVVARGMGKTCIVGCSQLLINETESSIVVGGKSFNEGDHLTLDGATGEVYQGIIPTKPSQLSEEFNEYLSWADEFKQLGVRVNAETPEDLGVAVKFSAEGIGLCRTEHMFFSAERILAMREMIFAKTESDRRLALEKIIPFQTRDFREIFKIMTGKPVNIRLLDPPLHEFLPVKESEFDELASSLNLTVSEVKSRKNELYEFNPMLGHRGCRLGVSYPEIYMTQVKAIANALAQHASSGESVTVEIMVPLVGTVKELALLREKIEDVLNQTLSQEFKDQSKVEELRSWIKIGTMIELPRAALTADEIAECADFFSFGTNDLTQTTFGLSRDDSSQFLPDYISQGMLPEDPFVSIDQSGVGKLMEMGIELGRKSKKSLSIGLCGEHGGDDQSIQFCHSIGLDYVSCSPYRVPLARLASAQAKLRETGFGVGKNL